MDIVERILAKIVGQEISVEEMEEIAGGKPILAQCCCGLYFSSNDGGEVRCDS